MTDQEAYARFDSVFSGQKRVYLCCPGADHATKPAPVLEGRPQAVMLVNHAANRVVLEAAMPGTMRELMGRTGLPQHQVYFLLKGFRNTNRLVSTGTRLAVVYSLTPAPVVEK